MFNQHLLQQRDWNLLKYFSSGELQLSTGELKSVEGQVKTLRSQPTNGEARASADSLRADIERPEAEMRRLTDGLRNWGGNGNGNYKLRWSVPEPFDPAALGVFTVTGRNTADRENKLWDMIQTISNEPLKSLTYETVK